jgi:hypothetical protein
MNAHAALTAAAPRPRFRLLQARDAVLAAGASYNSPEYQAACDASGLATLTDQWGEAVIAPVGISPAWAAVRERARSAYIAYEGFPFEDKETQVGMAAHNAALEAEYEAAAEAVDAFEPTNLVDAADKLAVAIGINRYEAEHIAETAREDLHRMAVAQVAHAHPSEFSRAVEAYEAQVAAVAAVDQEYDRQLALIDELCPVPDELVFGPGQTYHSEDLITDNKAMSFDKRAELVAAFREWRPRRDAAEATVLDGMTHQDWDDRMAEADGARRDAMFGVLEAAPATPADLAYQMRLAFNELHVQMNYQDIDTEDTASQFLTDGEGHEERIAILLYRSALRLAGQPSPALEGKPFDVAAWVETFEARPGHEVHNRGVRYRDEAFGPGGPGSGHRPIGEPDWLALSDWKKDAVKAFAEKRDHAHVLGWISNWGSFGGTISCKKGEIWLGCGVRPDDFARRDELFAELDADPLLKSAVRAHIRQREGVR